MRANPTLRSEADVSPAFGGLTAPIAPSPERSHPVPPAKISESVFRKTKERANPREAGYRFASTLLIGDATIAAIAIFVGLFVREWQRFGWNHFSDVRAMLLPVLGAWSIGGTVLFMWLMMLFRTYETANLYRLQKSYKNLLKSAVLWAIAIWACVGLFRLEGFTPRVGTAYCIVTLITSMALWRLVAFAFLIQPRVKESVSSRTIVVGWNTKAEHLRHAMRADLAQLREIIGCVPVPGGHLSTRPPAEVAILGEFEALPKLIKECKATSIVLADVSCSASQIESLIAFCQRELIGFQMIPQYFPALNSGLQVQPVSGVPLLGVNQLPLDRTLNRVIKRGIDIVGALIGLTICALIVPFFSIIVWLESPGPVIFRQRRTSRSGRDFYIYKIRSMKLNAETGTGAVWAKQEDPRRLKIGTFMRKTNVDELPQFWNVLKGDMSLVGPRPERPELIERFKDEIPNYNVRHEVRAGLTGWAQINGLRGDTDLRQRIEADIYYLENWSVMLDLYCIFATFFKVKNAY